MHKYMTRDTKGMGHVHNTKLVRAWVRRHGRYDRAWWYQGLYSSEGGGRSMRAMRIVTVDLTVAQ